jgi:hypothetical protein
MERSHDTTPGHRNIRRKVIKLGTVVWACIDDSSIYLTVPNMKMPVGRCKTRMIKQTRGNLQKKVWKG